MKRIISVLIVIICLTASMPAMAANNNTLKLDTSSKIAVAPDEGAPASDNLQAPDQYDNSDILTDWATNGYPDDVGGVFYDQETGKTTILLVNSSIEREDELSALVPGVAFLPSAYSYNELLAVQDAITKEMTSQSGGKVMIYSAGIGFTTIDGKLTGFGKSGKEFRVVVSVDNSMYAEMADRFYQLYGDMVYVESGTAPVTDGSLDITAHPGTNAYLQFALITVLLLAALVTAFSLNRRRHNYALQTSNGDTVSVSERMTRKQIVEAVKEAVLVPSDAVYERIQKDI